MNTTGVANVKAGGKEGRREEREFLWLLLSLRGLPVALREMAFSG